MLLYRVSQLSYTVGRSVQHICHKSATQLAELHYRFATDPLQSCRSFPTQLNRYTTPLYNCYRTATVASLGFCVATVDQVSYNPVFSGLLRSHHRRSTRLQQQGDVIATGTCRSCHRSAILWRCNQTAYLSVRLQHCTWELSEIDCIFPNITTQGKK